MIGGNGMTDSYIGVDLDGTLAYHGETWDGVSIHAPVPLMLNRVKYWLDQGKNVRIITARLAPTESPERLEEQAALIKEWCLEHLGQEIPAQSYKCHRMTELWDDRAVQVFRDTGIPLAYLAKAAARSSAVHAPTYEDHEES